MTAARPRPFHPLIDSCDLLLACAPWWALALSGSLLAEAFRPAVVVPLLILGSVAGFVLRPDPYPIGNQRAARLGMTGLFAGAGLSLLVNAVFLSERFIVVRDPDIYTLTAQWLVDHPATTIPAPGSGPLGFASLVPGEWHPQGNHLTAAVGALFGWVLGPWNVGYAAPASGAFALLGVYAVARRVVNPLWALVPGAALAMAAPMVLVSRSLYSEPTAMVLAAAGALYLLSYARRGRTADAALAGLAFGAMALARIDGVLTLIAVPVGLVLVAGYRLAAAGAARPASAAWFAAAAVLPVSMGLIELRVFSTKYFETQRDELVPLYAGAAAVWAVALVVPVLVRTTNARVFARLGQITGGLLVAAVALAASRPWWYTAHGDWDNPTLAAMQAAQGMQVDGTRTYAETTLNWMAWYVGWPPVLIGLALLAWSVVAGSKAGGGRILLLAAVAVPSTLLYLARPSITPDQAWALRRFLPVVLPAVLIGFAFALQWIWNSSRVSDGNPKRVRVRRWVGAVAVSLLGLSVLVAGLGTLFRVVHRPEHQGAESGLRATCEVVEGRPVVYAQPSFMPASIRISCGVPVAYIPAADPAEIVSAAEQVRIQAGAAETDPVLVLTNADPAALAWAGPVPEPAVTLRFDDWSTPLQHPPRGVKNWSTSVWAGQLQPDGKLTPL